MPVGYLRGSIDSQIISLGIRMRFGLQMQKFKTSHDIGDGFSCVIRCDCSENSCLKRRCRIESWCMPLFKTQDDRIKRESPGSSLTCENTSSQTLNPPQMVLPGVQVWSVAPVEIPDLLCNFMDYSSVCMYSKIIVSFILKNIS